ncbi:hypothetical protein [Bacillus cereus]|uniref:hypothetical protein n=1 Tax=Bacillus cereus TaxID=1396 RepID=UPI000B4B574F|nr:hypothetical protein [Bacillus cereus]
MLQNNTILTVQYEWKEQKMDNEESLEKVQDLITAIKSAYYFSSLLTMTEKEFDEWYETNRLLVDLYDAKKHLHSLEKSLENYVQVPSVTNVNSTSGILHFGFNGEILLVMLKWLLEKVAPVVAQEFTKEWSKKLINLFEKFHSKGQTEENQESNTGLSISEGRDQESSMDRLVEVVNNNPEMVLELAKIFEDITFSIGDASIELGGSKIKSQESQKN